MFTCGSYEILIVLQTAGAGDVVAAALPNLKCLRKVLQTVGLCGKLQEVSVEYPKPCEVGMRCV